MNAIICLIGCPTLFKPLPNCMLIRDTIINDEIRDIPEFQNFWTPFTIRQLSAKYTYIRKYDMYDIYDICQHHSMTYSGFMSYYDIRDMIYDIYVI